jgi:hypothetical protein
MGIEEGAVSLVPYLDHISNQADFFRLKPVYIFIHRSECNISMPQRFNSLELKGLVF